MLTLPRRLLPCRLLLLLVFWVAGSALATAQNKYTTENKKAISYYEQAQEQIRYRQMGKARQLLEKALEKDTAFQEAHRSLAEIGRVTLDENLQVKHLKSLALLRPNGPETPSLLSVVARHAQNVGQYAEAEALYQRALASSNPLLPELKKKLERGLASAQFARQAVLNPLSFTRQPLPPTLNRFPLQYTPSATADNQMLVYTARKGIDDRIGRDGYPLYDEDIYAARRDKDGNWLPPASISPNINTRDNEGTSSISADGRTLVFASCSQHNCDIYISHRSGEVWTKPQPADSVNSPEWDSQPCISADGNTMVFTSARPGGMGRHDLYIARRWPNGKWGRAVNAGPVINTDEDEIMPYLHPNGRTLFFGSKGHIGMGGYDLFMADRAVEPTSPDWKAWNAPKNLGYPLNTDKDESSIFISPDGSTAYYCIEDYREGTLMRSLIYEFNLGSVLQMQTRSYFAKGVVQEAGTGKFLNATVDLVDNATGRVLYSVESDKETGQYLMVLPEGSRYGLTVSARGYLFQSRYFNFADAAPTGSVEVNFDLEALKQGARTVLNNVFFPSGSAELLPDSRTELARVAALMKANPKLKVEIAGFTDNVGTAEDNQALSRKRAQTVRDFLVSAGTPVARLAAQGYGQTHPAASNATEEGRAKNRRIEFSITAL